MERLNRIIRKRDLPHRFQGNRTYSGAPKMTRNGKTTESHGNAVENGREEIIEQLDARRRAVGLKIDPEQTIEQWLAIRRAAGLKIDPETAEVMWIYAQTVDPYGVYPEPPDECWQVGREYFARSPGSDIWVNFGDLPEKTRGALWKKHKDRLAISLELFIPDGYFDDEPSGT